MKRNATAIWVGSGKEGNGNLSTQSNVLDHTPYTWASRFEQAIGTNPEELIAAAHAGCFTMKLSFILGESGITPEELTTTCEVTLADGKISTSHLKVSGKLKGMSTEDFGKAVKNAEINCPISKSLTAVISSEYELIG